MYSSKRAVVSGLGLGCLLLTACAMEGDVGASEEGLLDPIAVSDPWPSVLYATLPSAAIVTGDPQEALIASIDAASAQVGIVQSSRDAVTAAALPDPIAAQLALTLDTLTTCTALTQGLREALPGVAFTEFAPSDYPVEAAAVRLCAQQMYAAALALDAVVPEPDPLSTDHHALQVWPVISYHRGTHNDVHVHDYLLLVDEGGNDLYVNNQGSNIIDVRRGPAPLAPEPAPRARGCQAALTEFITDAPDRQCDAAAALLIDRSGNDTYGEFQVPDTDLACTSEPVVRRIGTIGAGIIGVGILIEDGGNDTYNGKTVTMGSAHVAGVGFLHDRGGNDTYLALRSAMGSAFNGATGILRDDAGHDDYDFYMPTGGILNDVLVCDNVLRQLQGAAGGGGHGLLDERGGDDRYVAGPRVINANFPCGILTQLPEGEPRATIEQVCENNIAILFTTGHQGSGSTGGTGLLHDRGAGTDTYIGTDRTNDMIALPTLEDQGVFIDE